MRTIGEQNDGWVEMCSEETRAQSVGMKDYDIAEVTTCSEETRAAR